MLNPSDIKKEIREVPNFPKKGILFYDLTTAFNCPKCMKWFENELVNRYETKKITKVIGVESRGFILGTVLANKLEVGFVPIRKKGKLPADVYEITYEKEYGFDTIELHKDALNKDDIVVLHDDLLATGGTMEAAIKLVQKAGVKKIYLNFLAELDFLKGRESLGSSFEIESLIHY